MDFRSIAGNALTVGFTDSIDQSRSFAFNADRTALGLAFLAAAIDAIPALVSGALCGFLGGWFDACIMRIIDALPDLPGFLLAICLLGVFGGGGRQLVLFLVLTGWAQPARTVRNEIAVVEHLDFIAVNTALGYSVARNLFIHALPAVIPSLLVLMLNSLVADVSTKRVLMNFLHAPALCMYRMNYAPQRFLLSRRRLRPTESSSFIIA